ncbi:MAG: L,D-transpeptidase family protein [Labrys sp. (in: a-proteobacteria)]
MNRLLVVLLASVASAALQVVPVQAMTIEIEPVATPAPVARGLDGVLTVPGLSAEEKAAALGNDGSRKPAETAPDAVSTEPARLVPVDPAAGGGTSGAKIVSVPALTPEETTAALGDASVPEKPDSAQPDSAPATPVATVPVAPASSATRPLVTATERETDRETRPLVAVIEPPVAAAPVVKAAETLVSASPDAAYAERVRTAIAERFATGERGIVGLTSEEASAVAAFYASRGNGAVWTVDGRLTEHAVKVLARLAGAEADGLSSKDYTATGTELLAGLTTEAAWVGDAEVGVSAAILAYARHAAGGRIDPNKLSKNIQVKPHTPDPLAVLTEVADASDPAAVLDGYNPRHPGFLALRAKLAEVRAAAQQQAEAAPSLPLVPEGPLLKPGMSDPRVAVLRARLGVTTMSDADVYDEALADAVKSFQRENSVKATGIVGERTVAALNAKILPDGVSDVDEIVANMERWRWLPREMGAFHIFVNVPEFRMEVQKGGAKIHESRVIVGKPNTPTPIFSDTMEYVVVNPYWHVPVSIIRNEFIPKLRADPTYLSRRGYELVSGGRRVDASQIDWTRGMPRVSIRQPPGGGNALGHIKFMFPNDFSVYLHDTSSRGLFGSERRAFSHGCVRVDQPFRLAEVVMGAENGWTEEKVKGMIGGGERRINLVEKLPVHIAYFTAAVDETGALKTFEDIYGYDRRVIAAIRALN